ncbi:hypothetical protein [Nocardia rhizosphaerae]|uniref:Hemophore-related protein n=1 Tax=Nocardia rhizosphaerae TaxID=1691571 RepID=A0ABV8L8R9_9NOCA
MPHRRWKIRPLLATVSVLAVAGLTGCASVDTSPSGSAESSTPTGSTAPSTTTSRANGAAGDPAVDDAQAAQLCDMFRPELSNFRVQGPTLGRLSLNAMVLDWVLRNPELQAQVVADKTIVDRVTESACPDVRAEVLTALELPDLASGLVL